MKLIKIILGIFLISSIVACDTINYISIETYNPSQVTFPKNVRKVLIANNAGQTNSVKEGNSIFPKLENESIIDSAVFDACHSLGKALVEASYFEDVLLFNDQLKQSGIDSKNNQLPAYEVKDLCLKTGADALITWDDLQFETNRQLATDFDDYVQEVINQIQIDGTIHVYLPDRNVPLAIIHVKDSLALSETIDDFIPMQFLEPSELIRIAGDYIGQKQSKHFVPHWDNETRWIYKEMGSRWKEADAYVAKGKWEQAADHWRNLYKKSGKWSSKAKAASNLALYYEMQTDLNTAYEWAKKSYDIYQKNAENNENCNRQRVYLNVLLKRLELNQILNHQIDEK